MSAETVCKACGEEFDTRHNGCPVCGTGGTDVYRPFKPPFVYDVHGQLINDSEGDRVLDMRGWGRLTGRGSRAAGFSDELGAAIQDRIGRRVVELMNADAKRIEEEAEEA